MEAVSSNHLGGGVQFLVWFHLLERVDEELGQDVKMVENDARAR